MDTRADAEASLPPLRETVRRYGLAAKKNLGQHFLLDLNVTAKIVRLCGDLSGIHVTEIGPGPGGLTRALLFAPQPPASVYTVEKDERCLPVLEELRQVSIAVPLHILAGDALQVSLPQTVPAPRAVVANLPYNVGTPLLVRWLQEIAADPAAYRFLALMFQKEVADRLSAQPGSGAYGRLSVLAQWLCEIDPLFDLPAAAFTPPPKVDSSIVRLTPRSQPLPCSLATLERVTAAAFGQRRKMLRSSLKSLGGEALLAKAGIDPSLRAENLTVAQFVALASHA